MKAYFRVFVNYKQNGWARFLLMAKFVYNNAKNTNTSHISFKLNCDYYLCISNKKNINPYSKSKSANEL